MKNKTLTILALAACTLAPLTSFAADRAHEDNVNTAQARPVKVHMMLKNLSNLTQNLVIQGRPVTLAANSQISVELPVGTQVMGADNTVRLTVTKDYNNAVASFR